MSQQGSERSETGKVWGSGVPGGRVRGAYCTWELAPGWGNAGGIAGVRFAGTGAPWGAWVSRRTVTRWKT